MKDGH